LKKKNAQFGESRHEVKKMAEPTAVLKKVTDEIQVGKFDIDKDVGLTIVKSLDVSEVKDGMSKYGKKAYLIKVSASHPHYKDMSFTFHFMPKDKTSTNFSNKTGHHICEGQLPHGEIKDIVIAAVSHESYAFQLSLNRTTWVHAEHGPENGEYLIWHYIYYGRYSPRSVWRVPKKCEKEKLWLPDPKRKKDLCNACLGTRCEFLGTKCACCGNITSKQCPKCKTSVCENHSHCSNGHYNLTPDGMFEGLCRDCRRKMPLGEKVCKTCGCKNTMKY
jgi:hypothetical protein